MNDSIELPNRLALDSSVFIAYFLGENIGQLVRDRILSSEKMLSCSHLALSETFYVLCREKSRAFAQESLEVLRKTNYAIVQESTGLDYLAAGHKCQRSISLADCYVLALAEANHGSAVFARRENDIVEEMKRKPFQVDIVFLDNLARSEKLVREGIRELRREHRKEARS